MKKRILSMLLVLVLCVGLVGLAGCGSTGTTSSAASGTGTSVENDDSDYFDSIPAELIGTSVKFATWIDHSQTEAAPVFADFTESTGIKVELTSVPQGEYIVKLSALIAAEQSPDIVVENGDWPLTLTCLMPLDEAGIDVTDPFWDQEVVKYSTIGKKTYLVNAKNSIWNMSSAFVGYNKSIFEDYSIKTPTEYEKENNWTWETFRKIMKEVVAADSSILGAVIDANAFSRSYDGLWVTFDPDTDKFTNISKGNTKIQDAYKFMLECKEAKLAEVTFTGTTSKFTKGEAAMALQGAFGLRKTGWLSTMDPDDIGFANLPKKNASDSKYPSGSTFRSYGVCKGSKNAKAAGYFLRFFLNGDNYNMEDVFDNEEAKKWYFDLKDRMDMSQMHWTSGVYKTVNGSVDYSKDVLAGSAANVLTNINKVSDTLNEPVNKANQIIAEVIANQ